MFTLAKGSIEIINRSSKIHSYAPNLTKMYSLDVVSEMKIAVVVKEN